jgi:quinol monooxygenase YgiN
MITRIVHLEFQEDRIAEFLAFFETIKQNVNSFPGCLGMKLYQDVAQPTVILTYSHWKNQDALEEYRKSETFGAVWTTIKPWFSKKPEAWTVNAYFDGFTEK